MNLEKVSELIGESSAAETRDSVSLRLKELQRKHESWGGIAGLSAFGLSLALFIGLVVSQMILKGGFLILLGSILILLALAAGVMVYFLVSAQLLKQKLAEPQLPQPMLPPLVSVTEQTTKLLTEPDDRATHEIPN
jgi:Flp pilus assembly protein TadB